MSQNNTERCVMLIDDIRETLSRIPAKALRDVFLLYEYVSSPDSSSVRLKNAAGLLLGLKQVWEHPRSDTN